MDGWSEEDRRRMQDAVQRANPVPWEYEPETSVVRLAGELAGKPRPWAHELEAGQANWPSRGDRSEPSGTDHHGRLVYPTMEGSGRGATEIYTEPSRDYRDDTSLVFDFGVMDTTVRLTPADVHRVRAVLNRAGDLNSLTARAREAGLSGRGHGTDLAASIVQLAREAHAAGYQLCAEDYRLAYGDAGILAQALEELPGLGDASERDSEALNRVLAMLRTRKDS
jgi:hypothetical protein